MKEQNNHYVPQFIQKRFGDKINVYNLDRQTLSMQKRPDKVFCVSGLYNDELEKLLNKNAESKVANLLPDKIINSEDEIVLSREEILLLKRFLAIESLRTPNAIKYIKKERAYFENQSSECLRKRYYFDNPTSTLTDEEYLSLTLRNLLENEAASMADFATLLQKPTTTLVAQKWLRIFNSCYIAFWDSKKTGEEFIITDEGMACEHDPSKFMLDSQKENPWNTELLKPGFMVSILESNFYSQEQKEYVINQICIGGEVAANFYLFSLTATRTIVLIDPFFGIYDPEGPWHSQAYLPIPDFWPSAFLNKGLVKKNKVIRENPEKANCFEFGQNDKYVYRIHDMQLEDVFYCNALMLDRIDKLVGFGNSQKIIRSLATYLQISKPEKDYRGLKKALEAYGYTIPESQKYKDLARGFFERPYQELLRNKNYIQYALRLAEGTES